jgi:hypothetical protein
MSQDARSLMDRRSCDMMLDETPGCVQYEDLSSPQRGDTKIHEDGRHGDSVSPRCGEEIWVDQFQGFRCAPPLAGMCRRVAASNHFDTPGDLRSGDWPQQRDSLVVTGPLTTHHPLTLKLIPSQHLDGFENGGHGMRRREILANVIKDAIGDFPGHDGF